MADRDDPASCPSCGALLKRVPDATQGLLTGFPDSAQPSVGGTPSGGPTLINCSATGNKGAAIYASGGHIRVRNFTAVDNGGPAFELRNGATVDADGVIHITRKSSEPLKSKKSRRKNSGRDK